jgi:hypothetical protein
MTTPELLLHNDTGRFLLAAGPISLVRATDALPTFRPIVLSGVQPDENDCVQMSLNQAIDLRAKLDQAIAHYSALIQRAQYLSYAAGDAYMLKRIAQVVDA